MSQYRFSLSCPWSPNPVLGIYWCLCTYIPVGTLGSWIIARAAVAVFVAERCLQCCWWETCREGLFPLSPSQWIAQALTQNQLSLLAPLKPFSSLEAPATLASGRWVGERCDLMIEGSWWWANIWALGGVAGRNDANRPTWRSSEQW